MSDLNRHREQVAQWFHERDCAYGGPRKFCSGDCGFRADDALASDWLAGMLDAARALEWRTAPRLPYDVADHRQRVDKAGA
jgi:hypothetical protein